LGIRPAAHAVVAAGFTWFAVVLLTDAVLSPAATGWVWLGIGTRPVYSMSVNGELPKTFQRINRHGTPIVARALPLPSAVAGWLAGHAGPGAAAGRLGQRVRRHAEAVQTSRTRRCCR